MKRLENLTCILTVPDAGQEFSAFSGHKVGVVIKHDAYGPAIEDVVEDAAAGRMYVLCHDEPQRTQVNFCPFTGRKARVQIEGTVIWGDTILRTSDHATKCMRKVMSLYAKHEITVGSALTAGQLLHYTQYSKDARAYSANDLQVGVDEARRLEYLRNADTGLVLTSKGLDYINEHAQPCKVRDEVHGDDLCPTCGGGPCKHLPSAQA